MSAVLKISERLPEDCERVAIFDLDFTLIPHDTMLLFCNYVVSRHRMRLLYLPFFAPFAVLAGLRLISARTIKRFFFSFLFRMPEAELRARAERYVAEDVLPRLFPEILERVRNHREQGDYLILNTASPMFYVEHIGRALAFDACCATNLQVEATQRLRPRIVGANNKHAAKLDAMRELFGSDLWPSLEARARYERAQSGFDPAPLAGFIAYSDSTADLPILRLSEHAVTIAPGARLRELATEHEWEIVVPQMPFADRTGKLLMMMRQALGLYPLH